MSKHDTRMPAFKKLVIKHAVTYCVTIPDTGGDSMTTMLHAVGRAFSNMGDYDTAKRIEAIVNERSTSKVTDILHPSVSGPKLPAEPVEPSEQELPQVQSAGDTSTKPGHRHPLAGTVAPGTSRYPCLRCGRARRHTNHKLPHTASFGDGFTYERHQYRPIPDKS